MNIFLTISQIILSLICISGIIFSWRNKQVYKHRMRMLTLIGTACDSDIRNHREYKWRYEGFDKANYDEMVRKFWRNLDLFYDQKIFDPNVHKITVNRNLERLKSDQFKKPIRSPYFFKKF